MKKTKLLELLKDLPDDAEIGYGVEVEDGTYIVEAGFTQLGLYINEDDPNEQVWLLNVNDPDEVVGYKSPKQSKIETERNRFISTFPEHPMWYLKQDSSYRTRFFVIYTNGSFSERYTVYSDAEKDSFGFDVTYGAFTSWDNFFCLVAPNLKAALEKYMKNLIVPTLDDIFPI